MNERCITKELITRFPRGAPEPEVFICRTGKQLCDQICTSLADDPRNCGRCGNECLRDQDCLQGQCKCPSGGVICNGSCVDIKSDPAHCGTCNRACAPPNSCYEGSCKICPTKETQCGSTCANLDDDPKHCGACGNACAPNEPCHKGKCGCLSGEALCSDGCAILHTSNTHCGRCDNPCSSLSLCKAGVCECPPSYTRCGGSDCIDTASDDDHCGGCFNACGAYAQCVQGKCSCTGNARRCVNTCVDVYSDPDHCGQCGIQCQAGQACVGGKCQCKSTLTSCGNGCADLTSDRAHCGACSNACQAGEICQASQCVKACLNRSCGPDGLGGSCGTCPQGEFCSPSGTCDKTPTLLAQEVHVKPGSFTMGAAIGGGKADELPAHQVALTRHIALWKHEVTDKEFSNTLGYKAPNQPTCQGDCPVVGVTSYQAMALANAFSKVVGVASCYDCQQTGAQTTCTVKALYQGSKYQDCPGFRLPTEAEWEYAARAGTTTPTYGKLDDIAWTSSNAGKKLQPVETKDPNAWGLYDMLGNAAEWVFDLGLRKYSLQAATDPISLQGADRVIRGGHFLSTSDLSVTQRDVYPPNNANLGLGFRLCRTLQQ